jgi:hypothetical protein
LVFDWILDKKNQKLLDINLDEFKHQLATSKEISSLGINELYILNRLHKIPIILYDQYDTPLVLIDGDIKFEIKEVPKNAIHIQYGLTDVFDVKKIKSLTVNKVVSVYEI